MGYQRDIDPTGLWHTIQEEAETVVRAQPLLSSFYRRHILYRGSLYEAVCSVLAEELVDQDNDAEQWFEVLSGLIDASPDIAEGMLCDLLCQLTANASIKDHSTPLLYFGGFHALQCHRFAHSFWKRGDKPIASYIQAKVAMLHGIDIHPAAEIGKGIFLDHAIGIVVGETAVIEDGVTIFQGVTLGSSDKDAGDRHPKIRRQAFLGAGASIIGNIEIGEGARIGAGAIVLKPVKAHSTVVGVAAKAVSRRN